MEIKDKAIWYWQDRLAKFFPTSKGPTNVELEMFKAGYEKALSENLRAAEASDKTDMWRKSYTKEWCQGFCTQCGTGCAEYSEELFQMRQENEQLRYDLENSLNADNIRLRDALRYVQSYCAAALEGNGVMDRSIRDVAAEVRRALEGK